MNAYKTKSDFFFYKRISHEIDQLEFKKYL